MSWAFKRGSAGLVLAVLAFLAGPVLAQTFQSLGSASLSVTSASSNVALPAGNNGNNITVQNVGLAEAFINLGGSTVVATTANESVPASAGRCFQLNGQTYLAAITASSTATLRISQGSGPCALSFKGGGGGGGITPGTTVITGGTTNQILYDNAGIVGEITKGNSCVYLTNGSGVPSCSTTLPSGMTGSFAAITASNGTFSGAVINTGITSDTGLTDASVCAATTTGGGGVVGQYYKGSGTLGVCLGTSSARYKHDIEKLDVGLAEIEKLQPVSYRLNADRGDDPNKMFYGFTAEQGITVLPQLAGLDSQGRPNTFDYLGIVPVLVKAVQQLKAANDNLEVRLKAAEGRAR